MRHPFSRTALSVLAVLVLSSPVTAGTSAAVTEAAAKAYEHLANVIIEMNAAEDALVEMILTHHYDLAMVGLANGDTKSAAAEITNIANEGGKSVQAVRQRLLKAGHHHHSDAETEEDYMFIDSREKKELLDLAGRVGRGGDAKAFTKELEELFARVMSPE